MNHKIWGYKQPKLCGLLSEIKLLLDPDKTKNTHVINKDFCGFAHKPEDKTNCVTVYQRPINQVIFIWKLIMTSLPESVLQKIKPDGPK